MNEGDRKTDTRQPLHNHGNDTTAGHRWRVALAVPLAVVPGFAVGSVLLFFSAVAQTDAVNADSQANREIAVALLISMLATGSISWLLTRQLRSIFVACLVLAAIFGAGYGLIHL